MARVTAAVLASVLVAAAAGGCSSGGSQPPGPTAVPATSQPAGSPTPSPGGPDDTTLTSIGGAPVGLAWGFDAVWVAGTELNQVLRLDDQGNILPGSVPVGDTPLRLAVVPRGVWVSEFRAGTVTLLDPTGSRIITTVQVGAQPEGLASDGAHLWVVLQGDNRLVELDAASGAAVRTVRLPVGGEPRLAAYTPAVGKWPASVWVLDYGANRLVPVDAATGRVGTPVHACDAPQALTVSGPTLWVACQSGWLATVDLASHRARQVTDLRQLDGNPDAVTVADGKVWAALSTGPTVLTVDPRTGRLTGQQKVADDGPLVNADVDIVVAAGQVWVSSYNGKGVRHVPVGSIGPAP